MREVLSFSSKYNFWWNCRIYVSTVLSSSHVNTSPNGDISYWLRIGLRRVQRILFQKLKSFSTSSSFNMWIRFSCFTIGHKTFYDSLLFYYSSVFPFKRVYFMNYVCVYVFNVSVASCLWYTYRRLWQTLLNMAIILTFSK